jgi:hypothetical protein
MLLVNFILNKPSEQKTSTFKIEKLKLSIKKGWLMLIRLQGNFISFFLDFVSLSLRVYCSRRIVKLKTYPF